MNIRKPVEMPRHKKFLKMLEMENHKFHVGIRRGKNKDTRKTKSMIDFRGS
jgi:hypothetical protein